MLISFIEINSFTFRVPLGSIVCYSYTFENNLVIKQSFAEYLNESCCVASDKHFSFKYVPKNASVSKIFPKSSGLFLAAVSVNVLRVYCCSLGVFVLVRVLARI